MAWLAKWGFRVLVVLACWQFGGGLWIYAKASMAQWLIADAWGQTVQGGKLVKPWPWADTWPIARLQVGKYDVDLFVLEGAQGNSLAFGPGHLHGSALPGEPGASIVGGHRDTHFRFLQDLQRDDLLEVTTVNGELKHYRITGLHIVDSVEEPLMVGEEQSELILVTCYPFDALRAGGPLRYLARAELINQFSFSKGPSWKI